MLLSPAGFRRSYPQTGGARKRTAEQVATLVRDLEHLIEPLSRGDPESPLRWTCKSVRKLAQELSGVVTVSATVWWPSCCMS